MREKMTLADFSPDGVTGTGTKDDMFYHLELVGPNADGTGSGAQYWLYKEPHHSRRMLHDASVYIMYNFDVVHGIKIIEGLD